MKPQQKDISGSLSQSFYGVLQVELKAVKLSTSQKKTVVYVQVALAAGFFTHSFLPYAKHIQPGPNARPCRTISVSSS